MLKKLMINRNKEIVGTTTEMFKYHQKLLFEKLNKLMPKN